MVIRRLATLVVAMALPGLAHAAVSTCTDGVDCYCDCVEDTSGTGSNVGVFASATCQAKGVPIDPELVLCEDFEDPTYEAPDPGNNNWRQKWGAGTTPCTAGSNGGALESGTHNCINILQKPGCPLYNASDPDRNETGGHSTLNGAWDGCQSWYYPQRAGGGKGGQASAPKDLPGGPYYTLSMTVMKKYSSNHYMGTAASPGNVKGDRYFQISPSKGDTNFAQVMIGGRHAASGGSKCWRGPNANAKFPFGSLIKSTRGSGGINGGGLCCDDSCFSDAATRIGTEGHSGGTSEPIRIMAPPVELWNPAVPGGVPMSIEGNKDGRDEWLCMQWSLEDMVTNNAKYRFWVNNTLIMQMLNYKAQNDDGPIGKLAFLNQHQKTETNNTNEDYVEVRDNWHLSASATPPTCAQVGFDGNPVILPPPPPPPPPPSGSPPNTPEHLPPAP